MKHLRSMAVVMLFTVIGCAGQDIRTPAFGPDDLLDVYRAAVGQVDYLLEPVEGSEDSPRPLCLVLPGGGGEEGPARGVMAGVGTALVKRGWAVVVPIEARGESFIGRNGRRVPKLIRELQLRDDITDDRVVAVGVSNGGIAALEIAAEEPKMFSAVVAVPGVASRATRVERLRGMPVYLRVGEEDNLKWGQAFPQVAERLRRAGVRLNAKLISGAGHGISIDWDELDVWLEQALGEDLPVPRLTPPLTSIPESDARAPRIWTSISGRRVTAALVRIEGETVVLRSASGSMARIRISQLSTTDREYLRGLVGAK